MTSRAVRTSDILAGHVDLDVSCLDRIYLNGYVPNLQVGGQVVGFLASRGFPIPSPAAVGRIGDRFRASVRSFADNNKIAMVTFRKGDRKIEKMTPYLARQAKTGRSGVAAIGWAQEFQWVASCTTTPARHGGAPHFGWGRAERRVTCYYFYVWDDEFGPGFVKIGSYFPYPIKVWLNGHEWAKRQADKAGDRLDRLGERIRHLHRSRRVAGDLRPARTCPDPGVFRSLAGPAPGAADRPGPGLWVLVGAVDAADRGLPHDRVRPAP